ncbi:hypothetical protein GW17_00022430, partial [Ensete ventricosum]
MALTLNDLIPGTTHVVVTERSSATTNNLSGARTERSTTTSDVSCDNTFGSGFGIFPSYNLSAIEAATCDFSNDSKLGEGAFGIVYKVIFFYHTGFHDRIFMLMYCKLQNALTLCIFSAIGANSNRNHDLTCRSVPVYRVHLGTGMVLVPC